MTVMIVLIVAASIVLTKLINAAHDYAVTRTIVKHTGKVPHQYAEEEEDDVE